MRFSQRIGKKPKIKKLQIDSMDESLKNSLWNIVKRLYLDKIGNGPSGGRTAQFIHFAHDAWHNFFKLPIDRCSSDLKYIEKFIRDKFYYVDWFETYDLIEYMLNFEPYIGYNDSRKKEFVDALNNVLEREFSGYKIINNKIAPISNEVEFDEVSEAIFQTEHLTAMEGANIHLNNALDLISDKKNPNYSNSVKESISAVEAVCRIITGESTLGKSLKKLESKGLIINNQIKTGFEKIYAYTNSKENGIRHAIIEEPIEPDFEDAKYMIVSCSAFINFIIGKAQKINLI